MNLVARLKIIDFYRKMLYIFTVQRQRRLLCFRHERRLCLFFYTIDSELKYMR